MEVYLEQLERLKNMQPHLAFPSHGPVIALPEKKFNHYIKHRTAYNKVLQAVIDGYSSVSEIAVKAYDDTPDAHPGLLKFKHLLTYSLIKDKAKPKLTLMVIGMQALIEDTPSPAMPRRLVITKAGSPSVLDVIDMEMPTPKVGEVCIEVYFAGINFADTLMRLGLYQPRPPFPFTPGYEVSGTIHSLGEGVTVLRLDKELLQQCQTEAKLAT